MKKLFNLCMDFSKKMKNDRLGAYASESTLFIIMSFVPFIMLLITLLRYTPITENWLTQAVVNLTPDAFDATFVSLIHQMYTSINPAAFLLMIVSILWAAGKGFHSIIDGLNSVYQIDEKRNWFIIRLVSILYTLIFIIVIIVVLALYVLGHTIRDSILVSFPELSALFDAFLQLRIVIVIALLTIFFTLLYIFIPRRYHEFRSTIPGAVVSAIGWAGFSYFFSLYVEYSKNLALLYGSLTTIVCTMLWLYTCMYIFLFGAEVNVFFAKWIGKITVRHKERKKTKKRA